MAHRDAERTLAWLEAEASQAADPAVLAPLRAAMETPSALRLVVQPHGTTVGYASGDTVRRTVEFDRHGTLLAVLGWAGPMLETAWIRIPDRSWLAIEPGATTEGPWGRSDRLKLAARIGDAGTPLTVFEALDYARIDRIPTLAEPARLPGGGGVVVLNLLAGLAVDQGRSLLDYRGPYPTEQLFLALMESFRYVGAGHDPLAAFRAGAQTWRPAPHERRFARDGVYVQLRDRVETVGWRGRRYHRPDWQAVERHAPRRVWDAAAGPRCSLWALGAVLEDHLELTREGEVTSVFDENPPAFGVKPLPPTVARGLGAVVAAISAPPLADLIRAAAADLVLEWGPVRGDLIELAGQRARLSGRLRVRLTDCLRAAGSSGARARVALAALTEIAHLLGDHLRADAQARVLALPEADQRAVLAAPPPIDGAARVITDATQALLDDASD